MPMPKATSIKPTHKALKKYYAALQSYRDDGVTHEGALETAFQRLLEETAKSHGWKLIPKQKLKVGKQTIYPDGTLRDLHMRFPQEEQPLIRHVQPAILIDPL